MNSKFIALLLTFLLLAISITGCTTEVEIETEKNYNLEAIDSSVTEGNADFAIDIFKTLNEEDLNDNIFISPLSISTALSMTYNGALGQAKEDMMAALRYSNIDLNVLNTTYRNLIDYLEQADEEVELLISNSIWYRKGDVIKEDFLNTNKDFYDAEVRDLDFSDEQAAHTINNWISESTKGKIEKMLEPPISPDVVMYLINAVYFKGEWTNKFDESDTYSSDFTNINNKKESIELMRRYGEVEYTTSSDYKAVKLPYGQEKIAMYVILPDENVDINTFIKEFSLEKLDKIKEDMSTIDDVNLQIPKFKLEYGIKNLNASLSSLGMASAFGSSANFDNIRDNIFISRVLHKAVIEVNEEGSEAAAVTVVEMKESAVEEPIRFIANRPFLFLINDESTDTILFMGKYSKVD
ncbi:MAG: serpin family protein [Clostridiales bacterium]|nr:serpin family protein [Clostridiales bacterium]